MALAGLVVDAFVVDVVEVEVVVVEVVEAITMSGVVVAWLPIVVGFEGDASSPEQAEASRASAVQTIALVHADASFMLMPVLQVPGLAEPRDNYGRTYVPRQHHSGLGS